MHLITWIKRQGGINYAREHMKGEVDFLRENANLIGAINKSGNGLTLDELALRARDEGYILSPCPQALINAISTDGRTIEEQEIFNPSDDDLKNAQERIYARHYAGLLLEIDKGGMMV
jgi:hypothetical protein